MLYILTAFATIIGSGLAYGYGAQAIGRWGTALLTALFLVCTIWISSLEGYGLIPRIICAVITYGVGIFFFLLGCKRSNDKSNARRDIESA